MKILESNDSPTVRYKSSISQHRNTLCVMKRGEWLPISYDVLDFIDCECARHHKAYMSDGTDAEWQYPVGECKIYNTQYVLHDDHGTDLATLPEWFGAGMYLKAKNNLSFINSDTEALGVVNETRLRVGLNYAVADKTLPGE